MNAVNEAPPQVAALKGAVHGLTADLQQIDVFLGQAAPCLAEVIKHLKFAECYGILKTRALERLCDELEWAESCVRQARDLSELSWRDNDDLETAEAGP